MAAKVFFRRAGFAEGTAIPNQVSKIMSKELDRLLNTFDQENQTSKREIGKYLHDRPGKWIPKSDLEELTGLDESVVGRHVQDLHDEGFVQSKLGDDGQLYARWNASGAGGFEFWLRRTVPSELREAGETARPLLTLDYLGGAYVPTLLMGLLYIVGFCMGISTVVISHYPGDSILGITVIDTLLIAGFVTVFASVLLVVIPFAILLDRAATAGWERLLNRYFERDREE